MAGAALTPYFITIVMWLEVIYLLIIGEQIVWYEWVIVVVWSVVTITHFIYIIFFRCDDCIDT